MKILFVSNGLTYTDNYPHVNQGSSVQTWGVCRELSKKGYHICVVRRAAKNGFETYDGVTLVNVKIPDIEKVVRIPFMSSIYFIFATLSSLWFSIKSYKAIQRINPDIICLVDRFSGLFLTRLNTAKIYILHVPDGLCFSKASAIYANKLNSVMFNVKNFLDRIIMHRAKKVIALNKFIQGYLKSEGVDNVLNVPNGINVKEFSDKEDDKYVLYAGKFDWNKNVSSLIEAFSKINNLHADYKLLLVGSGPEEEKIRTLVKDKGLTSSVKIIPWLPRNVLIEIMSKCTVFVLPSTSEVFPVVILEAMSSAKPVIARKNMGSVDIITNGYNGFLYYRQEELVDYLNALLSDFNLRRKIGINARKTIEANYTFEKIAESYSEIFMAAQN